jgi:hypothetical protein
MKMTIFRYRGSVVAIMGLNTQRVLDPFRLLLIAVSAWMNHRQLQVIEYLREENRVLREQLGGWRVRLNGSQRRRWP